MTIPEQGSPPPEPQKAKGGDTEAGGGFIDRIKQGAIDNYNGLYKIVLEPSMPEGMIYGMSIVGLILGIIWAYTVAGTAWTGANPNRLNEGSQEQWLRMVAISSHPTVRYDFSEILPLVQSVPNPVAQIESILARPDLPANDRNALTLLLNRLGEVQDVDVNSAEAITAGNPITNFLMAWIVPIIVVVIVVVVITLLWRLLIYENLVAPVFQKIREMRDPEERARAQKSRDEIQIQKDQAILRKELAKQVSVSELGDPVMTQLAIFTPGRSFDESYEIELESGDFLGQSGTVLAEATDPDPVAIEVWLFDMFTSKNIAKIFVTPQGNADPAIRSKLEGSVDNPATDIIVADIANPIRIDTDKLRLEAKFASLEVNANGRFEKFNLQMRAWNKDASSVVAPPPVAPVVPAGAPDMSAYNDIQFDAPPPMPSPPAGAPDMSAYDDIQFDAPPPMPSSPAGAPDMSAYDDIQFDPPPPMPSNSGQGSGDFLSPPPMTPLSPPPLSSPDEDDDPFGGTGDFTPLGGS